MGWTLAVDFGTTATAAAIHDGDTELLEVDGSARLPSLVMLAADGGIVVGNTAQRQAATAPERVERTPKRRLGDPVVLLGEEAVEPTELVAAILRHVAAEAMRRQGGTRPDQVVLTHPVSWAGARLAALRDAARRADLGDVTLLSEPVAAALHLGDDRIEVGDHVAVYDLGGGTFDVAVLRRTTNGFEPVGTPGGDDRLGGEDFDQILYEEVGERIDEQDPQVWTQLRTSDERSWIRANAALRDEVRAAKEALSSSPEYTIYVGAPADLEVVITRERFEDLVREQLGRTVDELIATVDRAGLALSDIAAVHLVGGSSRIPLVTRLLSERTGLVPTTWGDPKASVALGAAARLGAPAPVVLAPPADEKTVTAPDPTAVSEPAVTDLDDVGERPGSRRRRTLVLAVAGAMILLVGALALLLGGDDPENLDAVAAGDRETPTTEKGDDADPPSDDIVIDFGASEVEGVTSSRTWTLDPATDVLTNELAIGTTATEPVERTHIEVIPKELAADVADLTFSPEYSSVVQADPVVRYDLVIQPEKKVELAWSVKTPDGLTEKQLGALSKTRNVAEEKFYAELAKLGGEGSEDLLLGAEPAQNDTPTVIDGGSGGDDGGPVGPIETTSTTAGTIATTTTTTTTTPTTTAKQYTIPGAPTNVLVKDPSGDIGAVSVTLTWSAPSNTGGGLSGYRLTAQAWGYDFVDGDCVGSLKPLGSQVLVDRGTGTSTTVQLGEQTAYACSWVVWTIRSINAVGQTSASAQARGLVPSSIVSYRHTRAISGRAYAQTNCEANPGLCAARGSTIVAGTYVGAA